MAEKFTVGMTEHEYFDPQGAFTSVGLWRARRDANLTQAALAGIIARDSRTIGRWENGGMIPSTAYPALCRALGIDWPHAHPVDAEPGEQR
jgi:DNA-binding XRE family transcriptional regulator